MSLPIRPREHSFPKTLNSPPSARSTSSRPSTITSPIESARQPTGVQYWIGSWSSPVRSHRGTSQTISTVLAWKATTQWNVAPTTIIRPRTNRGEWYLHRYQSTNISRTSRSWTTLSTTTRHRLDQEKRTGIATTSRRGPFPARGAQLAFVKTDSSLSSTSRNIQPPVRTDRVPLGVGRIDFWHRSRSRSPNPCSGPCKAPLGGHGGV